MKKHRKSGKKVRKSRRKRHRVDRTQIVTQRLFPVGRCTIPDRLKVQQFYTYEFKSGNLACPGGRMAYFNVNGNVLSSPMVYSGSGPVFQPMSTAVAAQGFAGTTATDFGTSANPGYYSALLQLYQEWYVSGCKITIDVDPTSAQDDGDLYIGAVTPINANTTSAQNLAESRYGTSRKVGNGAFGMLGSNTLTKYLSTRKILGLKSTDDQLASDAVYVGSGTSVPSTVWIWQVGYHPRSNTVLNGNLTFRVRVTYFVTWVNPVKLSN